MKSLIEDGLSKEDEQKDNEDLHKVVDNADYLVNDEAADVEALEDEADLERMLQAIKKSAASKIKRRRQTLPAKRDSNGDRIWKAIVLQSHGLGTLTATLNSMVDKTRCARRFEERSVRLLQSVQPPSCGRCER